jgi:predicted O-methyltransferase YrrM
VSTQTGYVMDPAWREERVRLQGIETMYDPITREQLTAVGIAPGWSCLEVGGGAGGVAMWMASVVGTDGHVVATDLDPRFLEGLDGIEVRRHDIVKDDLEPAAFDLIHSRMVLEHIPDREQALARMIPALKPGGWLVIEDIDFGGPMVAALARYTAEPGLREIYERILAGFEKFMTAAGADLELGTRLVRLFEAAGLVNVYAEARARLLRSGESDFARLSADQLREPLIAAGLVTGAELDTFLAAVAEPSASTMSLFLVSARGQRPAGP